MNETESTESPPQKAGCTVRAFLIVLPVGLAFMVPISLWIYYQKKYKPAPATSQYAALLRRDLNAEDFARYTRILSQDIGERSLAKPDNLDAAASFIESTMGYDNMGYAVRRQAFEANGKPLVNLLAELPGKSKSKEIVLVLANYDDQVRICCSRPSLSMRRASRRSCVSRMRLRELNTPEPFASQRWSMPLI